VSGLEIIHIIQSVASPGLDRFFVLITDLHHENIYILMLPLLLWFYEKGFARFMISVFIISVWSNGALKEIFNTDRPPHELWRGIEEPSKAFPSGHAQGPIMVWGALALEFGKQWFTVLAALLVFLIGFSRVYLGVHWPMDVVGGWLIGAVLLWGFEFTRGFWVGERMALARRLLWATIIPFMTLLVWRSASWDTPKDGAGHSWILTGAFLGFWIGQILEEHYVGFDPRRGTRAAQVVKLVVGVGLVLAAKEGLKLFLPPIALGDLIRYFGVSLVATLLAPWLFHRFIKAPPMDRTLSG
jgi:membrane-associated phospholipid phosphatase